MNVASEILNALKAHGTVAVPEFGVFSTENSAAVLDSDSKTIAPPAKQIVFEADYSVENNELLQKTASKNNISFEKVKTDFKTQTDYWKKLKQNQDAFTVEGLGDFYVSDDQLIFKGKRIETDTPEFFGLEEINLSQIKNSAASSQISNDENAEQGAYKLSNSILWIFLLLIPVSGLAYFGITQKDLIFGEKSFDDLSVTKATKRIEKAAPVKIDSAQIKADSIKKDSIAKAADVPAKKVTKKWSPKKKWSAKKNIKKKWRPKKRQNR